MPHRWELPEAAKVPAIAGVLETNASDPVVMDAALSGVAGGEARVLDRIMQDVGETPVRTAAITMLAATIVRGGQEGAVLSLFDAMGKATSAPWQRSALLGGAEVALLDRAAPGSLPRRDVARGGGRARPVRAHGAVLEELRRFRERTTLTMRQTAAAEVADADGPC